MLGRTGENGEKKGKRESDAIFFPFKNMVRGQIDILIASFNWLLFWIKQVPLTAA